MPPKKKATAAAAAAADTSTSGGPASKKQRRGASSSGANASQPKTEATASLASPSVKTSQKDSKAVNSATKKSGSNRADPGAMSPASTPAPSSSTKSHKQIKLTPGSGSGSAMDNHPYARGSVIEVLHGVKDGNHGGDSFEEEKKDCDDDNFDEWWDRDSDDEELENEGDDSINGEGDEKKSTEHDNVVDENTKEKKNKSGEGVISVRLCDIIDRVAVDSTDGESKKPPDGTAIWRYYVHYRDFNRRMDEWISMDRIVSPPSIGNAKARAIKREEEKKKRMLQREKEKEEKRRAALEARSVDVTAPRASRRRATAPGGAGSAASQSNSGSTGHADASAGGSGGAAGDSGGTSGAGDGANHGSSEQEGTRRGTRLRRKTSVVGGDADDTAGRNDGDKSKPSLAAEKGTVALSTIAATDSTKVGEHVVQTIAAQELDEHEGLDDAALREHEEVTKVKNVAFLELGPHQMSTWYFSPLPKELLSERGFIEVLYVCEFTLRMFSRKQEIRRFQARLPAHRRHPPGNEIYRKGNLSMFEVDGFEERIYCQNLCYIAKLFLDHKTLYFDVDPFLFYVLCEVDERGFHPVGYYSKEKYSDVGYNLACILTFPSHQRKGYGRFLIAFSYELSKKEEKVGSPEKPMSDLGQQAYKPYWASTIVDFLLNQCPNANSMSIMDISKMTSIMAEDIVFTLNQLSILKIINGVYFIAAEEGLLRTLAKKYPVKEPRVDPSKLHWTPFVMEVKRDKFSIHSKKPSVEGEETRGAGGF
ncbi:unnamed protein product [Pseudo-nitzschia multistriata]|uniref:Histone acetyltransferase n=1 Tax=Pseudo-nitzschia multistriata TaxID=183589 RepID=A0A448YYS6_9STRA|nr:unnamed protein product [Pseudo-nitzschia multistriata]